MRQKLFLALSLVVAALLPFIAPEGYIAQFAVIAVLAIAFIYFKTRPKEGYQKQAGILKKMKGNASTAHGSADFATKKDLKESNLIRENGFLLGKFDNKFLRFRVPGHLITFAPTRSGKGVGHVIPNLLDHPGSVVVNDIKGENYAVTGRHRATFSKVITFAPFLENSGCYNPIDFIRVGTSDELDDASLIADMIIVPGGGDEFWTNEAKNAVTGLILYVANESPAALRNLGEVRYLLMQDGKDFQLTIKDMQRSKNPIVQRMANSIAATEPKVLANVLSTAKSQTAVWDSPRLTAITSRSDFKLDDIKKEPTSFYVVIPPEYLDVYKPVVRLMMGITIATLTRTHEKPKDPTLFLIDEFAALGYMKNIESGVGYLAGYGISLWMFIQDLSQIKEDYPKWASLIANCGCRMAFGTNDFDTAKILSDMMGTTTVRVEGGGTSKEKGKWFGGSVSTNISETSRALMTPDEVMRMPQDTEVVFVQGLKPIMAQKIRYFADPEFKGKFDKWD
tara:strand:- start:33474 stop:34997 length:1524 start_codon:yes stop_codon:yes gene_type:complete